jgi:hypothetical protein
MAFRKGEYGPCNRQFTDINFDIGIDVSYTQTYGIIFSNLNLANAGAGSIRIGIMGRSINGTKAKDAAIVIRGGSFWGDFIQNILWSHSGLISIIDSLFNSSNKTSSSIQIQYGRTMINNNYIVNAITVLQDVDKVTMV